MSRFSVSPSIAAAMAPPATQTPKTASALPISTLISRTLPQLNVIAVGFSLNSMVMMLTLAAAMSGLAWVVQDHADSVIATIRDSIVFDRPPT